MKQSLSIDFLIERVETHITAGQGLDGNNHVPNDTLQLLATLHVAKQIERVANNLDRLYVQSIEKHLAESNVGKALVCNCNAPAGESFCSYHAIDASKH